MELKIVKFLNQSFRQFDLATRFISSSIFLFLFWLTLSLLIFFRSGQSGKEIVLATVLALGIHVVIDEGIMKRLFPKKLRPYVEYPKEVEPIGRHHSDSAFPSSHMASVTAIGAVYALYFPELWLPIAFLILFMGFARMHNGMHYPSDVAAGFALGAAYGIFAVNVVSKLLLV